MKAPSIYILQDASQGMVPPQLTQAERSYTHPQRPTFQVILDFATLEINMNHYTESHRM